MHTSDHIAAVMLAAGMSRRLGQPKQLLPVDGVPLVRWQLQKLLASNYHPVGVVLGHEAGRVMKVLAGLPVEFIHNPSYSQGMGSSVARAARWAQQLNPRPAALLLSVCDQIFLRTALFDELLHTWRMHHPDAIVCRYTHGKGVPVLVRYEHLPLLAACRGDEGARQVLRHLPRVLEIPFPQGHIEIDRPEDLEWLQRKK